MDKLMYVLCAVGCWASGRTAFIIILSPWESWHKCKQTPFRERGSKPGPILLTAFFLSVLFQKLRVTRTYFQIPGKYFSKGFYLLECDVKTFSLPVFA
jgi:hypothetical protein